MLNRLTEQGVVSRQEAGQASLYELNRDHLAAPAAEALAGIRTELFERLRTELASWRVRRHHASVFGSAARGDGDATSDVDLFVVRPKATAEDNPVWQAQLNRLAREVLAWTGNHPAIVEISAADVDRMRAERRGLVAELERDGVDLSGRKLSGLLKAIR
ncbi:MAG: nucleotidyltransferase domain-containing protein [Solirubrobacterales bacterium]